ncbi:ABC transporter permease [Symbiobacterium thermophilum]|nr:ABC transporter permease [Symbiobacterium thermophilum]
MVRYLAKRIGLAIPTALGVLVVIFVLMRAIPGDPARLMLGERASPEAVAALREQMGLNDPLYVQFFTFLGDVLRGDLGVSLQSRQPVTAELMARYPATVELAIFAMLLASVLGILAGVVSAVWRNSLLDYGVMAAALVGVSMPIFWLGLVLMMLFSVRLHWLPAGGRLDARMIWDGATQFVVLESLVRGHWTVFVTGLRHLILPGIALATIPLSIIARITRSSMLEVLNLDYIRTARAKGLPNWRVNFRHALKNALLPVVTIIGLQVGLLLGGAVLTETIFSWPGIGRYIVMAISARDYPVVQGGILLITLAMILVNLLVDVIYTLIDPRIRYQ